jgi:hypothetical protein
MTIDRATFERRFRELSQTFDTQKDNRGCVQCQRCERCVDCTFCVECKDTMRSTYCSQLIDCTGCTKCVNCQNCNDCQHCIDAKRCLRCAYVIQSVGCSDCTYCFGCIGLIKKDFHILNEPYDRSVYFSIVSRLSRELGIKVT